MGILWTIVIGFVAGIIAKLIHPGPNEPSGFILTTVLGSWVLSWRRSPGRRSVGTAQTKVRGSLVRL